MAKIPLTQENLRSLYRAFEFYYPDGTIFAKDASFSDGDLKFESLNNFLEDIEDTSGIEIDARDPRSIKAAQIAIEQKFTEAGKQEKPEANKPQDLEQLKAEEEKRAAAIKETEEKAKVETEAATRRAEIYAEQKRILNEQLVKSKAAEAQLANKKVYVKVEEPQAPILTDVEKSAYDKLKFLAQKDPRILEQEISQAIQVKIPEVVKAGSTQAETALYADSVAAETVIALTRDNPAKLDTETAILISAATNENVIRNSVPNLEVQETLVQGTNDLARLKMSSYIAKSSALDMVVGANVRQSIIGPNPAEAQILFVDTQSDANFDFDLGKVNDNYQVILQNPVFSAVEGDIKSRIFDYGKQQLLTKINSLSPESSLGKIVVTDEFQGILAALQPYTSFEFVGAQGLPGMFGKFISQFSPESAPLVSAFGKRIGVDFGFKTILPTNPAVGELLTDGMAPMAKSIGGKVAGQVGKAVVKEGIKEGVKVAATETLTVGGPAAAGAAAGSAVPVLGTIIGAAIGFVVGIIGPSVISWISDKRNKNKEMFVAIPAGIIVGLIAGPVSGIVAGVGSFGIMSVATGSTSIGKAFSNAATSILSAFSIIWATFLGAIGGPILAALIALPVLIVFILLIINSGAYLVPPGQSQMSSTNPYISVQKTANPSGQLTSPTSITYTVTITAKKDILTGILFKSSCTAIKKSGGNINCGSLEKIPAAPTNIPPGTPFTFTFTSNYDSKYSDALVTDSITVSATSNAGGKVSETGTASICFGDCPLNCFKTVDSNEPWPANFKANLDSAAATLGGTYPNFAAKVCADGTVNLCYTTKSPSPVGAGLCNQTIYARHVHSGSCDINFNQCGIRSQSDALFILTHESTHHIQNISGGFERQFEQQVPKSEWPICTYGATADPYESMAEGDALFVGKPSWNSCVTNYASQYPKHYLFAKNVMFAP